MPVSRLKITPEVLIAGIALRHTPSVLSVQYHKHQRGVTRTAGIPSTNGRCSSLSSGNPSARPPPPQHQDVGMYLIHERMGKPPPSTKKTRMPSSMDDE
ncbi:hypothetical protein ElyMa_000289700 [Elysia marginata]|uniref:Uncharacterized protein n=1 Tax=Elysia marginata TaxID=1093978 RepID=A0AAV4F6T7_9GAST|nr:hypothetical protein ElyMa_000289700 [Elysia marginata]